MTRTPPGRPPKPVNHAALGPIYAGSVYPLRVFQELTGLGHKGVATAKRQGLRVVKVGRVGFVLGADALTFFERLADEQAGAVSGRRSSAVIATATRPANEKTEASRDG